ncbi:MAG: DUF1800 family protein, partial [Bacteroidetes bacterium]
YDLAFLLETIFRSEHFYAPRQIGARIKSPVVYLVGLLRLLDLEVPDAQGLLLAQGALGQTLLQPPRRRRLARRPRLDRQQQPAAAVAVTSPHAGGRPGPSLPAQGRLCRQ